MCTSCDSGEAVLFPQGPALGTGTEAELDAGPSVAPRVKLQKKHGLR